MRGTKPYLEGHTHRLKCVDGKIHFILVIIINIQFSRCNFVRNGKDRRWWNDCS